MWSSDSDPELVASGDAADDSSYSSSPTTASPPLSPPPASSLHRDRHRRRRRRRRTKKKSISTFSAPAREEDEGEEGGEESPAKAEDVWRGAQWEAAWPGRHHPSKPVVLGEAAEVGRSRSLTDDDLEELKGCADLGFGFSYDEIPELRGTLPALELCYSMSQRLVLDDHPLAADQAAQPAAAPEPPVTNWKISSPGDSPDEVKARLKYWAQAVACTVRLCS